MKVSQWCRRAWAVSAAACCWAAPTLAMALYQSVVGAVITDPEPQEIAAISNRQRTVVEPDAHGPEPPYCLEMQRRVSRIVLQDLKGPIGELPHLAWQTSVQPPVTAARSMLQSGRVRPSSRSLMASSASLSNTPEDASCSNSPSHIRASNSTNHSRNSRNWESGSSSTARSMS